MFKDSAKNRIYKRRLSYLLIPIFFAVIGLIIMYVASTPFYKDAKNYISFVVADKAPDFEENLGTVYQEYTGKAKTVKNSIVALPKYDEMYGKLQCSELGMDAPVYWGDSDLALQYGVGTYVGSSLPGYSSPILLAGHNTTFFKSLENVKKGQIITFKTSYGNYTYEVEKTAIMDFNNISAINLSAKKEQLILYTCYPFKKMSAISSKRLFVYCNKVSGPNVTGIYGEDWE